MKKLQPFLFLIAFLTACCAPSEEVKNATRDAQTKALFASIIASMEYYEEEYQEPVDIQNSVELADVIEGENEKGITFYLFEDDERNKSGEILDAYGNPIRVIVQVGRVTLYSTGSNGIMDSAPTSDDIVMHYKPQGHNQSR